MKRKRVPTLGPPTLRPRHPAGGERGGARLPEALKGLGLAVFGLLVGWTVPEIGIRIAAHEYRLINFWAVNRDLLRSAYPAQFDSRLGWVPRQDPGGTKNIWGTHVTILEDGIRSNGPRSTTTLPDSVGLILALGDSFTFGDEVSDEETWPAYLERLTKTRTLNAGVFGYGLDQTMLRMTDLVAKYRPTCVVLSFIFDDVLRCALAERTSLAKPYYELVDGQLKLHLEEIRPQLHRDDPVRSLLGHSYLIHVLMSRAFPAYWFRGSMSNRLTSQYANPIACALLHSLGDYLGAMPHPPRLYVLAQYEKTQIPQTYEWMKEVLACAPDHRVHVVDLRDTLAAVQRRDPMEYERLFHSHMTPAGNQFVAEVLAKRIARGRAHSGR